MWKIFKMPIWWYTQSKEAKDMKIGTREEWERVEAEFIKNHPVLNVINEILDFFYYPVLRTWDAITRFFKIILPSFFVRGYRGWADCDTWGWYDYNAKVQRDVLIHLKKNKHGIPSVITPEDVTTDEHGNPTDDAFKKMEIAWDGILDNMIRAFNYIVESGEGNLEFYNSKADAKWMEEFEQKFKVKFMTKEQDDDMKKGFELYGKYYMSLWD